MFCLGQLIFSKERRKLCGTVKISYYGTLFYIYTNKLRKIFRGVPLYSEVIYHLGPTQTLREKPSRGSFVH